MSRDGESPRIMMVAGEASGDLLGAELLAGLTARHPGLTVMGVGGRRMREQGLESLYDTNDLSVIGLVEVLRRLPRLVRVFNHLHGLLKTRRPHLLITIDLPDFNFMLARRAKALGIPVLHYVGPQVWAWRRGRVQRIARILDHLLVLFPFETEIYAGTGLPVTFVGHPLVRKAVPGGGGGQPFDRAAMRRSLGVADGEKLVVLLPGSRHGELQRLLGVMVAASRQLADDPGDVRFVLALAETLTPEDLAACWPIDDGDPESERFRRTVSIRRTGTYDVIAAADAALVASGTATLETALLGTPMVVVYRVNRLTYEIGRRVIRVPFISLVNLVAGRELVPERIQDEARPEILVADLRRLLTDTALTDGMRRGFAGIRRRLEPPPRSAVDVVADFLDTLRDHGPDQLPPHSNQTGE